MTSRIQFSVIPFPPVQFSGDIAQLAQLLANHLQGNLDQSVFTGQDGGTEPLSDIGLWLDNDVWKHWDAVLAKYVPLGIVAGIVTNSVLHTARLHAKNTTADIDLDLPEEGGTLARIEDIASPLAPGTFTGNAISLDWTVTDLYVPISANCTVSDPGGAGNGQRLVLWIETPPGHGSPLTITFPSTWQTDNTTLGTTDATHRAVDEFVIRRIGAKTFVRHATTYSINQAGAGGDTSPPVVSSIEAIVNHSAIRVIMNENVVGASTPADWIVKKNGNNVAVSSVIVSGTLVRTILPNNVASGDHYTIQYTGSTIKDVAGNVLAHFGPSNVDIVQN